MIEKDLITKVELKRVIRKIKLKEYLDLVDIYLSEAIDVYVFEQRYLEMFKSDKTMLAEEIYTRLNGIFTDLDSFCPDLELRGPNDLNEQQLETSVRQANRKLREFVC